MKNTEYLRKRRVRAEAVAPENKDFVMPIVSQEVRKGFEQIQTQFTEVNASIDKQGGEMVEIKKDITNLQAELELTNADIDSIKTELGSEIETVKLEVSKNKEEVNASITNINIEITTINDTIATINDTIDGVKMDVALMDDEIRDIHDEVNAATQAVSDVKEEVVLVNNEIVEIKDSIANIVQAGANKAVFVSNVNDIRDYNTIIVANDSGNSILMDSTSLNDQQIYKIQNATKQEISLVVVNSQDESFNVGGVKSDTYVLGSGNGASFACNKTEWVVLSF